MSDTTRTEHDSDSPDEESVESLADWWECDEQVTLDRSDWSNIVEELNERIEGYQLGDHIDRMTGDELAKIATRLADQVDMMPPGDLLQKREPYQDDDVVDDSS